jgi:hypothetical protein
VLHLNQEVYEVMIAKGYMKFSKRAGHPWLTPIIFASQKAEIRRITVQGQPREIIQEALCQKHIAHTKKITYNMSP